MTQISDVLIVGGGLAGLSLADQLHRAGIHFQLIEARNRFGGRILTENSGDGYFDMGPAWFWPGQPRIAALIKRLGLTAFEQHYSGIQSYENEHGVVQRINGISQMRGSCRVAGGFQALTDVLAATLPGGQKHLNDKVSHLKKTAAGVTAVLSDGRAMNARHAVIATPPRVAAEQITFDPALPQHTVIAMRETPTWMAGQAKAVAVYDAPFWREQGLSGGAMSRFGPMVEIHDASPAEGGPYALFGFIGLPAKDRMDQNTLKQQILTQFVRLFGHAAQHPKTLFLQDWATEPLTATSHDHDPLYAHPSYGMPDAFKGLWDARLIFGGTEVATQFGGYLEGALEAAEAVFHQVQRA